MSGDPLRSLGAAVAALEDLEPSALSDTELHAAVVAIEKLRAHLGIRAATLISAWDTRRVWADNGARSPGHRLATETKTSLSSAKCELRRARKLSTMPVTAQAVIDGRLSLDTVDVLGRANHARRCPVFAAHEALLVEECATLRYPDAARRVQYWTTRVNAAVGEPEPRQPDSYLFASPVGDRVAIDGDIAAIEGAIVTGELDRLITQIYLADRKAGVERSTSARRAAALVEMAVRSASAPASGARRRALFTVLMGDGTASDMCELANGTIITPAQLAGWLDTALLETVLFNGASTVISVSHRRTFVGALRRAIQVRDRRCQHPSGCDIPAEDCDVDHIVPHSQHGPTDQFHGRIECPPHNRHPHQHDHDAQPHPTQSVTVLDEIRARLRWRCRREPPDDDPD